MLNSDGASAGYLIWVLKSSNGDILDASHLEFGSEQNLGLHGLVSTVATTRVTRTKMKMFHEGWSSHRAWILPIVFLFLPWTPGTQQSYPGTSPVSDVLQMVLLHVGEHQRHAKTWEGA